MTKLQISKKDYEQIKKFLFQDENENMILATCTKKSFFSYHLNSLFFPGESDFLKRTPGIIKLKAEASYPLLMQLKKNSKLSFIQIHSHTGSSPAYFSSIDNINNIFNTKDIRLFNPAADFFRIIFTANDFLAERYHYLLKIFIKVKVVISE